MIKSFQTPEDAAELRRLRTERGVKSHSQRKVAQKRGIVQKIPFCAFCNTEMGTGNMLRDCVGRNLYQHLSKEFIGHKGGVANKISHLSRMQSGVGQAY